MFQVPFFFRVVRPSRFLRGLPRLRTSATRRLSLDILAMTGAGWVGSHLVQGLAARRFRRPSGCDVEIHRGFGDWADAAWEASRGRYTLVATRDRDTLETIYGGNAFPGLVILRATRDGRDIGWAAVLDTAMSGHRQFGNLRVGSIVDGFSTPDDAPAVVRAATRFLEQRKVDLIVSNQSHQAWVEGLKASGFLQGPSNFVLALSKAACGENPVL